MASPVEALRALRNSTLFANLTDAEFELVSALRKADRLSKGKLLYEQGANDTRLFLIHNGQVLRRQTDPQHLRDPISQILREGALLNEVAFLTNALCDESIEAFDAVHFWYIERGDFRQLLDAHPQIEGKLALPPSAIKVRRESGKYEWLNEGERILLDLRKHWWVFAQSMWLPALLLVALVFVYVFLPTLFVMALAGVLLFSLAWTLWFLYDWRNDYYVVTDQRIIHRERVLLIQDDQNQLELNRIDNTRIDRRGFIPVILDFGDLHVQATGVLAEVSFANVPHPDAVNKVIQEQRQYAMAGANAASRSALREKLMVEMGELPRPTAEQKKFDTRTPLQRRREDFTKSAKNLRNSLLPRMRLTDGANVIYRHHWLQLLRTIGGALFAFVVMLAITLFAFYSYVTKQFVEVNLALCLPAGVLALATLLYLIYKYEDWRNDYFVLMDDRIVDIDRSPFGFQGTQRREATYDKVTNVDAKTKGFIDLIFDVGDVVIKTGSDNELVFERVGHPRFIQQDIRERQARFDEKRKKRDAENRTREIVDLIGMYNEQLRLRGNKPFEETY